jgi:hypothetical protein
MDNKVNFALFENFVLFYNKPSFCLIVSKSTTNIVISRYSLITIKHSAYNESVTRTVALIVHDLHEKLYMTSPFPYELVQFAEL